MENIEKIVDEVENNLDNSVRDILDPFISEDILVDSDEIMPEINMEDYYSKTARVERFLGEI
jgi:hypothetical protein